MAHPRINQPLVDVPRFFDRLRSSVVVGQSVVLLGAIRSGDHVNHSLVTPVS